MSDPYIYEFLYRGRPAGDPQPPAWHVVLGRQVQLPGAPEAQFVASGAMTPEQAEAAGFPLSTVLAGIDAAALAAADAARGEAEAARRERDAAVAEAADLRSERDAALAERDALAARIAGTTASAEAPAERTA